MKLFSHSVIEGNPQIPETWVQKESKDFSFSRFEFGRVMFPQGALRLLFFRWLAFVDPWINRPYYLQILWLEITRRGPDVRVLIPGKGVLKVGLDLQRMDILYGWEQWVD